MDSLCARVSSLVHRITETYHIHHARRLFESAPEHFSQQGQNLPNRYGMDDSLRYSVVKQQSSRFLNARTPQMQQTSLFKRKPPFAEQKGNKTCILYKVLSGTCHLSLYELHVQSSTKNGVHLTQGGRPTCKKKHAKSIQRRKLQCSSHELLMSTPGYITIKYITVSEG